MPTHYREGAFPPEDRLDWPTLIPLIAPAVAALVRYDLELSLMPNPRILMAPVTTREAIMSSRIEGIECTATEVLEYEGGRAATSLDQWADYREVINYRVAMRRAEQMLGQVPLGQQVVLETHRVLLSGPRGEGKSPGEYRRVANWIGRPGCDINDATFVPVDAEKLPDAMAAWEHYVQENAWDPLVQLAVLHAEFEALHPFLDGNGRLGRILVPLFLFERGLVSLPLFYVSSYFEARRAEYNERLLAVSRDDDWTGWCRFCPRRGGGAGWGLTQLYALGG